MVTAGIEIADSEGLLALSIRGVASRLGAPPMSLYRHVRSKEDLVGLMAEQALGEERLPEAAPPGLRTQLEVAARLEWKVLRRHPWLARVLNISRPTPTPNTLGMAEWVLRALDTSGLDAADRLQVHVLLHSFIQGLAVNLEAEAQALGETGVSEQEHMQRYEAKFKALTVSGRFPSFAKLSRELPADFELEVDALFEQGLTTFLDGLEARLARVGRGDIQRSS